MKTREAAKLLNVRPYTIVQYLQKGLLTGTQLPTGIWQVDDESVYRYIEPNRKHVIYARVSSRKQKSYLPKQIDACKQFMQANGLSVDEIYEDIASGIDLDRKGFQKLLSDVLQYKIASITVTFKDRLTRVGYAAIESIFARYGCKINIVDNTKKSSEQEILDEIVAMLHVYSSKLYGTRRKHIDNAIEHVKIVREEAND